MGLEGVSMDPEQFYRLLQFSEAYLSIEEGFDGSWKVLQWFEKSSGVIKAYFRYALFPSIL